jgi:ribosomal protein L37AE/L43A
MKFKNFRLRAEPIIQDAFCSKCRNPLTQIPNSFLSSVWYCEKCNIIYELRLVEVAAEQISQRFLEQYGNPNKSVLMASESMGKRTPEEQLASSVRKLANKEVIDVEPDREPPTETNEASGPMSDEEKSEILEQEEGAAPDF